MKLSDEAKHALMRIGAALADVRPDLNGAATDEYLIEVGLYVTFGVMFTEMPQEEILASAFTLALLSRRTVE